MFSKLTIIILFICCVTTVNAQSFLSRLQKQGPRQGKVTVVQDGAIDILVNGPYVPPSGAARQAATTKTAAEPRKDKNASAVKPEPDAETPDMHKKAAGKSYKVDGYRVQAYAGGNTRRDRQAAEQTGSSIKSKFPDEQIYVHFYSPRWICRVGNYRTYEEAHRMMIAIQKLGYRQASIVKGKITVQY